MDYIWNTLSAGFSKNVIVVWYIFLEENPLLPGLNILPVYKVFDHPDLNNDMSEFSAA